MDENSLITLVIALGGWVFALAGVWINYIQKYNEIYYEALQFLTGYTQKRNVGISVIENYWKKRRFRNLSIPLISNQSIYLLVQIEAENYAMEVNNLYRMMSLLLGIKRINKKFLFNYRSLYCAVSEAKDNENRDKGLDLPKEILDKWHEELSNLLRKIDILDLQFYQISTGFIVQKKHKDEISVERMKEILDLVIEIMNKITPYLG